MAAMATTASDTSSVTLTTRASPNMCHALAQCSVVKPAGHQVPNHCVENELTSTENTTPARLMKKKISTPQTNHATGRATILRRLCATAVSSVML